MINSAPHAMCDATDFHKHLIHVPTPSRIILGRMNSSLTDLASERGTEPAPPITDRFMADVDAAFVEQVFHILQ